MEMPLRWGNEGVYQDGKLRITCKTLILHEHATNHLECIQTRWHPNSPTDSHLLILLSDNSIRIFDESNLKHIWRIGPVPAIDNDFSYLKSLGDTAVDFDVAPPKVREDVNDSFEKEVKNINNSLSSISISGKKNLFMEQYKKIEWPIVILRGNGTIFVLSAGLNTEQPRIQGPLTVIPQLADNYGDDSCSLLVIPTLPITLVVAENSGKLHHILMIDIPLDEASFDETKTILRNDWDLYALETIELELGLSEDNQDTKSNSSTPLVLKRDPVNEHRYFCYHDAGLHGVSIEFVQQLQSYINEDSENDPNMNVVSKAEYILSTKAFNTCKINAVVGVGLLESPSGIFAILSSGQVVSLNTIKVLLGNIADIKTTVTNKQKSVDRKIPFDQHIKGLLQSGVTQPILKLDHTKPPSSQQAFELLMNSIQVMRDNHFKRHDQVRQEIAKRVKILECLKLQQIEDVNRLIEDKEFIHEKAYELADKHEDIIERQQSLQKRVQDVHRLASVRLPSGNGSEKDFIDQVKKIKSKVDNLLQNVRQVKSKHENHKKQFEAWEFSNENSMKVLPSKQEETIKEILVDMTNQITNLSKDVQKITSIIDV